MGKDQAKKKAKATKKIVIDQEALAFRENTLDCFYKGLQVMALNLNDKNEAILLTLKDVKNRELCVDKIQASQNERSAKILEREEELDTREKGIAELEATVREKHKEVQRFFEKKSMGIEPSEKTYGEKVADTIQDIRNSNPSLIDNKNLPPPQNALAPPPMTPPRNSKNPVPVSKLGQHFITLEHGQEIAVPPGLKPNEYGKIKEIFDAAERAFQYGIQNFWYKATFYEKTGDYQDNFEQFQERIFLMAKAGEKMDWLFATAKQIKDFEREFTTA